MPRHCLVLVLVAILGSTQDPQSALTGREKTARFVIHFRPGSRAEAAVDRIASLVEGDLDRILKELGLTSFPHTIKLYLYDDVPELQRITGVPSGGHSSPLESHVPYDNDQTRVHELVHVVAEKFTETGDEPRNLFFAEGLANAVLRYVTDLPIDAVAAFYKERGDVPPLADVHAMADFYAWLKEHPGVNGYDIAGSYMRYLLDTYGAAKVRRYYKGTSVKAAFGADLATIEKGWHARLSAFKLRPGARAVLQERSAVTAAQRNPAEAKLNDAILGPASAWQAVARDALAKGEPASWEASGALLLSGDKSQGDWCIACLGKESIGDGLVRCTLEPAGAFGVQIQIGPKCQGMVLRGQGAFVYNEVGGVAHDGRVQLGERVEIVLRRKAGKATVWVDGKLIGEGPVDGAPGVLGVGCVGGKARVKDIRWRRL